MTVKLKGSITTEDPRLDRLVQFDERMLIADEAWIAWLAGIFEGEGTISLTPNKRAVAAAALRVRMTDEDVVRRCIEVAGVGSVTGPRQSKGNRKPTWEWSVYNRPDVLRVLRAIRPFLGKRRGEKADQAIANLSLGDQRMKPWQHGTVNGYHRHRYSNDPPCPECREALRVHSIERRRRAKAA